MSDRRRQGEFNLNVLAGGRRQKERLSKMQMRERKKGKLIVWLIKKNCVFVCVCV